MLSISASDLLKQQKQKQRQLLQTRRQRALQNPAGARPALGQRSLMSPKAAPEVPAAPHAPTLGRGFSEGDDILFFDNSPPPAPAAGLSAAKLAALRQLRAKGAGLEKEDPNAVKRKRSDSSEISARVERNRTSPDGTHTLSQCVQLQLI